MSSDVGASVTGEVSGVGENGRFRCFFPKYG